MGKDQPRRARHRRIQSGAKTAGFLGVRASRGGDQLTCRRKAFAAMANAKNLSRESYYLTTAIAYPNGVPHIGHAYEAIATDALARFQRLDGKDVFFLTGTDEHGLKMIQTAQSENMTPSDLA